jgi:hypothetical protein
VVDVRQNPGTFLEATTGTKLFHGEDEAEMYQSYGQPGKKLFDRYA